MSRIGKAPITAPEGITFSISAQNEITFKGPKGTVTQPIHPEIKIEAKERTITFLRPTDQQRHKALHGLSRALAFNALQGVYKGYKKTLQLVGVGYKVGQDKNVLEISVGKSHLIYFVLPAEVSAEVKTIRGSAPSIYLESMDKQLLGQVCALLSALKRPEPYKGKGIRFEGEEVRRKAGKTTKK